MIEVTGVKGINKALLTLAINMAKPDTRLRIARVGAALVVPAMRSVTPMYRRNYHLFKRRDGSVLKVLAGNLTLSTQDLSQRRKRIADKGVVIVGPRYGRSGGAKTIGGAEASAYGNYAHMVYGSARAYGQQVAAKAAAKAGAAAMAAMQREAAAIFTHLKNKEGL